MGLVPLTKAAQNSARKGTTSALRRRQNSKGEVCPAQQNLAARNIFGRFWGRSLLKGPSVARPPARVRGRPGHVGAADACASAGTCAPAAWIFGSSRLPDATGGDRRCRLANSPASRSPGARAKRPPAHLPCRARPPAARPRPEPDLPLPPPHPRRRRSWWPNRRWNGASSLWSTCG